MDITETPIGGLDRYFELEAVDEVTVESDLAILECRFTDSEDKTEKSNIILSPTKKGDMKVTLNRTGFGEDELLDSDLGIERGEGIEVEESNEGWRITSERCVAEVHEKGEILLKGGSTRIRLDFDSRDTKGNISAYSTGYGKKKVNRNPQVVEAVGLGFEAKPDENFYGLGERFSDVNARGSTTEGWVTQGAGSASQAKYKNTPFFMSSRNYGCLVDTYEDTRFNLADTNPEAVDIVANSDYLSVVFIFRESMKELLSSYTSYIGRPGTLELWTFGFWSSRNTYTSWKQVREVAEKYRDKEIPCDVIHLDPGWMGDELDMQWGESFDNPEQNLSELEEEGFSICAWQYPHLPKNTKIFEEALNNGYLVENKDGRPYIFDDNGNKGIIDFTDREARDWWAEKTRKLVSDGVKAVKADFGEYLPEDAVLEDETAGSGSRNRYPEVYRGTISQAFRQEGEEPVLWSRSGWAKQLDGEIFWNGDSYSDWEGFEITVKSGLNAALSGYLFWSSDSGGYKPEPSDELYEEWMKWSALGTSHIRAHGKTPREPWNFEEAEEQVRKTLKERYRLIPYIYSYAVKSSETGIPLTRPVMLEYKDDFAAENMDTQHLVGENILIAPYLERKRERRVYIPEGEWINYWTKESFEDTHETSYSEEDPIPYYLKAGTPLPKQEKTSHLKNGFSGLYLEIYPGKEDSDVKIPLETPEASGQVHMEKVSGRVEIEAPEQVERVEIPVELVERVDEIMVNGEEREVEESIKI